MTLKGQVFSILSPAVRKAMLKNLPAVPEDFCENRLRVSPIHPCPRMARPIIAAHNLAPVVFCVAAQGFRAQAGNPS